jgi:hypothetical protein
MMRNRNHSTTSVFVKRSIEDTLPPTVSELLQQLQELPNAKIAEQVMRFGSNLRGTRSY